MKIKPIIHCITITLFVELEVPLQAAKFTKSELSDTNALMMPMTSMRTLYCGVHAKPKNKITHAILPG